MENTAIVSSSGLLSSSDSWAQLWSNLTFTQVPYLNLVVRALAVYLVILALLRWSGKKQLGQMGATELVTILLISNAVQNSMNAGDNSLTGGLVLAAVLVLISSAFGYFSYKYKFFRNIFEGVPTLLVHRGQFIKANLHKERMCESEVRTLLRKQGVHLLEDVENAIIESDGSLSVIRTADLHR